MIASAKQSGNSVYVYNERGNLLFTRSGTLVGFTSSTVTIQSGSALYTYDERGNLMFTK